MTGTSLRGLRVALACVAICGALACSAVARAAGPDLDRAEGLIRAGRNAEAFALLEPHEFDEAGNVRFDYLLGVAALNLGRPDKATLVFERVLAVEPAYLGVRLDLARAYYQMGDLGRATQEFQSVLAQSPPEDIKAAAQEFLADIQAEREPKRTFLTAYLELGGGYDDNVDSAVSDAVIVLPGAGGQPFFIDQDSQQRGSAYASVALGGELIYRFTPQVGVYAVADGRYRAYSKEHEANNASADGRAGVAFASGRQLVRLGGLYGHYFLDDRNYRTAAGGLAEWSYQPSEANQLSATAQYVQYRFYQQGQEVNDSDNSSLTLGWLRVFGDRALVLLNLSGGYDEAVNERPDGSAVQAGVRVFYQYAATPRLGIFLGGGAQTSRYDEFNTLFLVDRVDTLYDASIGLTWQFMRDWSLRPQLQYTHNASNVELYDFDRTDVSINLRKDFRR
jgi:FimV-like protein